ncbi:MAG: TlpA family protein disulfide reductase [Flavobacteriaceae bacterium]|nr:TlpA family protein disulfide reductase [Flavobacteriaceae bacterium]
MKLTKKKLANFAFLIILGLMLYPPTKVYFIRLISFSPSFEKVENQKKITNINWQLKGLNTKNVNFSTVKNKPVFISFWATWCPPCMAEMPSMQKLYKDYKGKVVFLFITNEDWETIAKFYAKHQYNFPTYNQLTSMPKELESTTIPATFIISKNGKIIVDKKGSANWNSYKIRTLLDNLSQ